MSDKAAALLDALNALEQAKVNGRKAHAQLLVSAEHDIGHIAKLQKELAAFSQVCLDTRGELPEPANVTEVRELLTKWKREEGPVHSQRGSGRGHELDGGGLTAGQGQLAQARDRNFDGVFIRCRDAITSIRETAKSATCCGDAFAELDDAGVRIHARLRFCSMLRTRLVAQLL